MSYFFERLRAASYKGIGFNVLSVSKSFLRRQVLHEYPQRDVPYLEDLGKGATRYSMTAFLCGNDCVEKAKLLEKVLLTPGPGTFVHPWDGNLTVSVFDASSIDYTSEELGYVSISVTFVEAGNLEFPAFSLDSISQIRGLADKLGLSAVEDFAAKFKTTALYQFVQGVVDGSMVNQLTELANSEFSKTFGIASDLIELAQTGSYLLTSAPADFATSLKGILGLSQYAGSKHRWTGVVDQLANTTKSDTFNQFTTARANEDAVTSSIESLQLNDTSAVETLTRRLILSQALGAASLIGSRVDITGSDDADQDAADIQAAENETSATTENNVTVSVDELVATRDNLLSVIDNELRNPLTTDEIFVQLVEARSAVFISLTQKAEGLSRLIEAVLPLNESSVVIAYDYYNDANREKEIVIRNKIPHSAFCPNELKLLSK